MTTHTQSGLFPSKVTSRPLVFAFIILALLSAAVLFAPRSGATRGVPVSTNPENWGATSEKRRRPEFVPGEALVRFKKDRAFEGAEHLAVPNNDVSVQAFQKSGPQGLAASTEQVLVNVERFQGSDLVDGLRIARMAPNDTTKALAAFRARDDVLYAEPNYVLHSDLPNDTSYGQLWGLKNTGQSVLGFSGTPGADIGAEQAWNITTGNISVVVGVIDEGIDISHPDLLANIWTNPSPGSIAGITGDLHGYNSRDNNGTIPAEDHATHVAGTIGAVGNNGVGVVGVNWQVSLMSLRFISQAAGSGTDADAIKAYNYAKQMRDLWVSSSGTKGANIRALNASYGGGGYSQAAADAINALGQSGILFVAAAGNYPQETPIDNDVGPHYPSNYNFPNVMSIAATDSNDNLASFSHYGARSVLMGAPGVNILSTTPANTYSYFSGTSMATPHVTGAAALLCSANSNLSVNQLRALLAFNGDLIPALQGKTLSGRRLNVFKSLQAMNEGDTTPPGTVGNFGISSQNGRTINLSWTASGDDGSSGQASLYDISFVDQFTGAVVPLTTISPAASGSVQTLTVNLPYRHTRGSIRLREFDNVGNEGTPATLPVTVDRLLADPYAASLSTPAALSTGGTGLLFNCDDCFKTTSLSSFSGGFPFFGVNYTAVTISSNGNIYFVPPTPPTRANGDADDVPSSIADLSKFRMIAGMWDDLDLRTSSRADADVYAVPPDSLNPNRIIFRWQGVPCNDLGNGCTGGDPVNFEIELDADGTIKTRYGGGNTNLLPVVGISGGEPDPYVATALTSELGLLSLTNAQGAVFTPRALVPLPTVQFSQPSVTVNESAGNVAVTVTRTGDTTSSSSVSFATADTAGNQNCNVVNSGAASSRCDYGSTAGTLQFGPGDTSRTITVAIVDDTFAESDETFTVGLSNASGASLGAQSTITITIHDTDAPGGTTPIGVTGFFVRQHYLDFLNREPDTAGLSFWINNIDSCGANQACIDVKRIDTSAAFFLSIEFQQTGYLVERIYKTAYGDADGTSTFGGTHQLKVPIVRFLTEFLPDTQEIGQGVVVNVGNWQQQLEENKQAFTAEFVQRSRFTTAFPTSMTPAQFVDKLFLNAGMTPTASDRTAAINEFGEATTTGDVSARSRALRDVAENSTLNQQEFNRAFVLMQYFGYLRRNPDDPQDTDYTGYDFWLTKLNQFNGNYIAAEMVKSFLVSGEYRQRFGP